MHQAAHFLEGRQVSPDALAQWTMLELRWSLLADFLAARPSRITLFSDGAEAEDAEILEDLRPLFKDAEVRAVIEGPGKDVRSLDQNAIRQIVGAV